MAVANSPSLPAFRGPLQRFGAPALRRFSASASNSEIDLESCFFRRYKSPCRLQKRRRLARRCVVAADSVGKYEGFNRGSTLRANMDRREQLAHGGLMHVGLGERQRSAVDGPAT
jgi:hypothetical protein